MSLFVKRLEQLVGLVDKRLDALAGRVVGATASKRPHNGDGERGGKACNAHPEQRAREVVTIGLMRFGLMFGLGQRVGLRGKALLGDSPSARAFFFRGPCFVSLKHG